MERGVVEPECHGQSERDHEAHEAGHDAGQRQVRPVLHLVPLAQHEHGVEEHHLCRAPDGDTSRIHKPFDFDFTSTAGDEDFTQYNSVVRNVNLKFAEPNVRASQIHQAVAFSQLHNFGLWVWC